MREGESYLVGTVRLLVLLRLRGPLDSKFFTKFLEFRLLLLLSKGLDLVYIYVSGTETDGKKDLPPR